MRDVQPALQPVSELWRYTLDLHLGKVIRERRLCEYALEFPAVNPNYAGEDILARVKKVLPR